MRILSTRCPACQHALAVLDNAQVTQHFTCDGCHVVLEVVRLAETVHEVRRYVAPPGGIQYDDYGD